MTVKTIIMCGCFRSGTTIAASMLNRHPEVFFTNELLTFRPESDTQIKKRMLVEMGYHIFPNTPINLDKLQHAAHASESIDPQQTMQLLSKFHEPGYGWYGDKSPSYTLDLDTLVKRACSSNIICCIRDVREVMECQVRNYFICRSKELQPKQWMRESVEHCLLDTTWLHYMESWRCFQKNNRHLCHELLYHKVAEDPEYEAEQLAGFLEIDPNPLKNIFQRQFHPKLGLWKKKYPNITKRLPKEYLEMMRAYGFEL